MLAQGKNLLLTPGVYDIAKTLQVKRADTLVVLGLGDATLHSVRGAVPLKIADALRRRRRRHARCRRGQLLRPPPGWGRSTGTATGTARPRALGPRGCEEPDDTERRLLPRRWAIGPTDVALEVNSDNVLLDDTPGCGAPTTATRASLRTPSTWSDIDRERTADGLPLLNEMMTHGG